MSDYDTDTWTSDDLRAGEDAQQHPWRHPINIGHLVMGLAFLGLVAIWGLWSPASSPTTTSAGCCRSRGSSPAAPACVATALAARRSAAS